jgi:hypothetical protein
LATGCRVRRVDPEFLGARQQVFSVWLQSITNRFFFVN